MKQRTLAMMTGFEQYTSKTPASHISGGDGAGGAVGRVVRAGGAALSPAWERAAAGGSGAHAADLLFAAVVQPVGPGGGRGAVRLGGDAVPDETTVCKFRHLLEAHQLGEQILGQVNLHLQAQGVRITTGTIAVATILPARTSTKNREQQRDPEMHQTKKGKQWYFGMKAHVGVDSKTKIIHTAVATAANVADSAVLPDLLHGEETRVWGDQAYREQSEVIRECAPQAQGTHRRYRYKDGVDEVERAKNRSKSTVRSKVEHVFAVMKLKFGFVKLRFRGLKKNATQLFAVCALVNLYLARKKLLLLAPA